MAFLWRLNCEVMGTHVMRCVQELMGSKPSDIVIKFEQNGLYTLIIIMEICKAPTLRLKVLNKHTHIMYIEMENGIPPKKSIIY